MPSQYTIQFKSRAAKQVAKLPERERQRIGTAIAALATNPRPQGCKQLEDNPFWRIRVGEYRVIYDINDQALVVEIVKVGHRKDVYR